MMWGPARIGQGLLTDSHKPVEFRFDGRRMRGLAGDTLASALLANGQRIVGRSLKYHRPRGIVSSYFSVVSEVGLKRTTMLMRPPCSGSDRCYPLNGFWPARIPTNCHGGQ
jgi:hypothetical protein